MNFLFIAKPYSPEIFPNVVKVLIRCDGQIVGSLIMELEKWKGMKCMLLHGNTFYADGEGSIGIHESESVHAFTEGV